MFIVITLPAVAEEQLREREGRSPSFRRRRGLRAGRDAERAVGRHEPRRRGPARCARLVRSAASCPLMRSPRSLSSSCATAAWRLAMRPRRDSRPSRIRPARRPLRSLRPATKAAFLVQRFVLRLRLVEFAAQRLFVLRRLRLGRALRTVRLRAESPQLYLLS